MTLFSSSTWELLRPFHSIKYREIRYFLRLQASRGSGSPCASLIGGESCRRIEKQWRMPENRKLLNSCCVAVESNTCCALHCKRFAVAGEPGDVHYTLALTLPNSLTCCSLQLSLSLSHDTLLLHISLSQYPVDPPQCTLLLPILRYSIHVFCAPLLCHGTGVAKALALLRVSETRG